MFLLRFTIFVCILSAFIYILIHQKSIQLIFHPDRYHGNNISHGIYFEGWYYKISFNNINDTFIFIPGVHMNNNNQYSFIMIGYDNISHFYRFPIESFTSSIDEYIVKIDNEKNIFSYEKLLLNLQSKNDYDDATENFQINLTLSSHVKIPDLSWIIPGTMGPYSWIPTMQCYHHVLSMKYDVNGSIKINENEEKLVSGIGYLEKDWGNEFPSIWIWGQANEWENLPSTSSASLFFSLALIPWYFNIKFPGFLVVFEYNQKFYRFNTYLQSIVNNLTIDKNTNQLSFNVYDILFEYKLYISTDLNPLENINGPILYGPRNGKMEKYVKEILGRNIYFNVKLSKLIQNNTLEKINNDDDLFIQHGYFEEIIFQGRAQNIALEITGDVNWLSEQFRKTYENIYPWNFSIIRNLVYYFKIIFNFF